MNAAWGVAGLVLLVGAVWWGGYQGRVDIHESQQRACLRGRLDRVDANAADRDFAGLARDAAVARRVEGKFALARRYRLRELNAEARIAHRSLRIVDCRKAFPAPSPLPHL